MNSKQTRDCGTCRFKEESVRGPNCGPCEIAEPQWSNWQPKDQAVPPAARNSLPEGDAERNEYPMFDGLLAYFPNALAEVARVSKIGNDQHNPGQDMHWDRSKSRDHGNKIMRHVTDMGGIDPKGVRHTARLAWRSLAALQEELELALGLPPSRASRNRPF